MRNPCIIIDTIDSSATEWIRFYPLSRRCLIFWHSGSFSVHNVRRRDMLRLLIDLKQSAGQWVNRYALNNTIPHKVSFN